MYNKQLYHMNHLLYMLLLLCFLQLLRLLCGQVQVPVLFRVKVLHHILSSKLLHRLSRLLYMLHLKCFHILLRLLCGQVPVFRLLHSYRHILSKYMLCNHRLHSQVLLLLINSHGRVHLL